MGSPRDDAPVFFTIGNANQKGAESSQEGSGGQTSNGETEGLFLKGKVRRRAGVGDQEKAPGD